MSGVARRLLAREREEETLEQPCECRGTATIQTAHTVHSRDGRRLAFAVTGAGHEPRITVTADAGGEVGAAGFVPLTDVRRLARALAQGAASTSVALRPGGVLPGGTVRVEQDGDDVWLVASPPEGRPALYGPVTATALAAVCRDVVGWTRLLAAGA
jgi:hypothetical protein